MINEFVDNGYNVDSTYFRQIVSVTTTSTTSNKWQWKSLKEPI